MEGAWGVVTTVLAIALGAGGIGGIYATHLTRHRIISETKLSDFDLTAKVNGMIKNELDRVVGQRDRLEDDIADCKKNCREANERADRLEREHASCNDKLAKLQERVRQLEGNA